MIAEYARRARRKLPAFGRELLELRRRGLVPERHPCVGHAVLSVDNWRWAQCYASRLVIAPEVEPEEIDFSVLAGLDVTVFWTRQITRADRFERIQAAILRAGPNALQVFEAFAPVEKSYVLRPGAEREAA